MPEIIQLTAYRIHELEEEIKSKLVKEQLNLLRDQVCFNTNKVLREELEKLNINIAGRAENINGLISMSNHFGLSVVALANLLRETPPEYKGITYSITYKCIFQSKDDLRTLRITIPRVDRKEYQDLADRGMSYFEKVFDTILSPFDKDFRAITESVAEKSLENRLYTNTGIEINTDRLVAALMNVEELHERIRKIEDHLEDQRGFSR